MKTTRIIILFILSSILVVQAGVFDNRLPSPRATAMSNAFVAVANDVWAGYYNPAGLAQLKHYEFGSAYQRPFGLPFFNNGFLGAALPLPRNFGSVSLLAETFSVEYENTQLSSETTIGLAHGFYLLSDIHSSLSFGYQLKYYHWKLGQSVSGLDLGSGATVGLDVGFQASIYQRTHVGIYVYNVNNPHLGSEVAHELPRRIVIGAAYRPYSGLTTSLALNKSLGFDTQVEGGFEFFLADWLALRAGASTYPSRFSAGLGLRYAGFLFDYSLHTHDVMAETHKFGLIFRIGG